MRTIRAALIGLGLLAMTPAMAAPCVGFVDVDDTSPFCASVEWIRNRAVTLGCAANAYCPNDSVTRLQMAAFMNRLGTALTAQQLVAASTPGAVDLDASAVVCQTADFAITAFPRRAYVDLALAVRAVADVDFAADLVVSMNGGAAWSPLNAVANAASVPANQWANVADLGTRDLSVGQTVRFGVRMSRLSGTANLVDSRCNLRAVVTSRDGTVSPL
jgi:hypothetical protein